MHTLNLGPQLKLPLSEVIGQCVAILGIRGSGKSNTAGVIFEELLAAHYPLSIVDIDGEYFGLKEKYEVLVVGSGDNVDVELDPDSAPGVAELSLREGVPVILDVSDMLAQEREQFVLDYLTRIWSLAGKLRKPYLIGIEECHEFIPQGPRTTLKEIIARIALRGRKRGLGAVIISQRSAKVEKDVLTQAGMLLLHRVVHEVDMRVYGELLPWPKSQVKEQVTALGVGECIFLSGQVIRRVKIRPRHTFHGGFTPSFKPIETPKLRKVRGELLAALRSFQKGGGSVSPGRRKGATAVASRRLERLETELALKEARIQELERRLAQAEPQTVEDNHQETSSQYPPDASPPDLPPEVVRQVERLLRRLRRLPAHHQRLVAFLAEKEPRAYTTGELAAWVDCPEGILLAEPPWELVELGLLFREKWARGTTYRAQLRAYVHRAFSGFVGELGREGVHSLIRHLRQRLCELPG